MTPASPHPDTRGSAVDRLLVPFADRSPAEQIVGGVVIPVAFGAVCGLALGWSAGAYWILQAIAFLGGLAAGFEHRSPRSGALRGVFGGLLFGSAILLGHALTGGDEVVENAAPAFLPLVTMTFGAALGALGGARRRAFDARRPASA